MMAMMKKIILMTVLFMVCILIHAQYGFIPGFVIKSNGDTLNGLVFYSTDNNLEKTCRFKRFEIAEEVVYDPSEIKAYGFRNGRYFESVSLKNKKLFLECLLKGEISLYIRTGKNKGPYYLDSPLTGFVILYRGINNLEGTGSFSSFKEILKYVLADKLDATEMEDLLYDKQSLMSVINSYNEKSDLPHRSLNQTRSANLLGDYSLNNSKPYVEIGVTAGYQYTVLGINKTLNRYLSVADYHSTYRPAVGVYLNRQLSKLGSPWSFDLAAIFIQDTYYGYAEYKYSAYFFRDDIYLDYTGILFPVGLKVEFSEKKFRPYIKAGLMYTWLLDPEYYRLEEKQEGDVIYARIDRVYDVSSDIGFHASAGFLFQMGAARKVSFDISYLRDTQNLRSKVEDNWAKLFNHNIALMLRFNL